MYKITIVIYFIVRLITSSCSMNQDAEKSAQTIENFGLDGKNKNYQGTLAATATLSETLKCPSTNVVSVKYKCPGPSNSWTDCIKSHCCPGYNFINGQCISANINPCSLNLCEQRCAFISNKIVCTCWDGYKFTGVDNENHGDSSMCIDIDECKENIHNCEQICKNIPGSFVCSCNNGFTLQADNKTCVEMTAKFNQDDDKCVVNCDSIVQLEKKIAILEEKLATLETKVAHSLNVDAQFAMPRGVSTSDKLHNTSEAYSESINDNSHSILDTFVQTGVGYCKCQRGPIGPPGPPGITGQKGAMGDKGSRGAKGAPGNLDFILLLLADVRHDITLLQERIFPDETPTKFDLTTALKKQRSIVDKKIKENLHHDDIENFQGSKTFQISNYTPEESFVESSGDEWDHYEE